MLERERERTKQKEQWDFFFKKKKEKVKSMGARDTWNGPKKSTNRKEEEGFQF